MTDLHQQQQQQHHNQQHQQLNYSHQQQQQQQQPDDELDALLGVDKLRTLLQTLIGRVKANAEAIDRSPVKVLEREMEHIRAFLRAMEDRMALLDQRVESRMEKNEVNALVSQKEASIVKKQSNIFHGLTEKINGQETSLQSLNSLLENLSKTVTEWSKKEEGREKEEAENSAKEREIELQREREREELLTKLKETEEESRKRSAKMADMQDRLEILESAYRNQQQFLNSLPPPPIPPRYPFPNSSAAAAGAYWGERGQISRGSDHGMENVDAAGATTTTTTAASVAGTGSPGTGRERRSRDSQRKKSVVSERFLGETEEDEQERRTSEAGGENEDIFKRFFAEDGTTTRTSIHSLRLDEVEGDGRDSTNSNRKSDDEISTPVVISSSSPPLPPHPPRSRGGISSAGASQRRASVKENESAAESKSRGTSRRGTANRLGAGDDEEEIDDDGWEDEGLDGAVRSHSSISGNDFLFEEVERLQSELSALRQRVDNKSDNTEIERIMKNFARFQQKMTEMDARLDMSDIDHKSETNNNSGGGGGGQVFFAANPIRDENLKLIHREVARLKLVTDGLTTDVQNVKNKLRTETPKWSAVVAARAEAKQDSSDTGGGENAAVIPPSTNVSFDVGEAKLEAIVGEMNERIENLEEETNRKIVEMSNLFNDLSSSSIAELEASVRQMSQSVKFHQVLLNKYGEKIEKADVVVTDLTSRVESLAANKFEDVLSILKPSTTAHTSTEMNQSTSPRGSAGGGGGLVNEHHNSPPAGVIPFGRTPRRIGRQGSSFLGGVGGVGGAGGGGSEMGAEVAAILREHSRKLEAIQLLLSMLKDKMNRKAERRDLEILKGGLNSIVDGVKRVSESQGGTAGAKTSLEDALTDIYSRIAAVETTNSSKAGTHKKDSNNSSGGGQSTKGGNNNNNNNNANNDTKVLDNGGLILSLQSMKESLSFHEKRQILLTDTVVALKRQMLSMLNDKADRKEMADIKEKIQSRSFAVRENIITADTSGALPSLGIRSVRFKCLSCERPLTAKMGIQQLKNTPDDQQQQRQSTPPKESTVPSSPPVRIPTAGEKTTKSNNTPRDSKSTRSAPSSQQPHPPPLSLPAAAVEPSSVAAAVTPSLIHPSTAPSSSSQSNALTAWISETSTSPIFIPTPPSAPSSSTSSLAAPPPSPGRGLRVTALFPQRKIAR